MSKFALMVLILISFNALAVADYSCDVTHYRLDVKLTSDKSTYMSLTDLNSRMVISYGFAKAIEKVGAKSHYFFYPGHAEPMKLSFNTQDTIDFPDMIKGRIETKAGGFLLWETMDCYKEL